MSKLSILATIAIVLGLSSCQNSDNWTIKGTIENGAGKQLIIESTAYNKWFGIDTVEIKSDNTFSISHKRANHPDIYRLRLDDKMLYLPIDSTETLTLKADALSFDNGYKLTGSPQAELITRADSMIMNVARDKGINAISTDSLLHRELGNLILSDPAGIAAYYIISKKIGNVPVLNPANKRDNKIIGAIANAYTQQRPNDPRTEYIKNLYLQNRPSSTQETTVYIEETPLLDINLYDNEGKKHSLIETASKGNVILLNFTIYTSEGSPAFNIELNRLYEKYHNRGLEIFQVSTDESEFLWRETAKNLPWITVLNTGSDAVSNLRNYNVNILPAIYIINRKGELVERITDLSKIESSILKQL